MSEPSLDQAKALTYLGQAGLRNISSSLIKGDVLIDLHFLHPQSD